MGKGGGPRSVRVRTQMRLWPPPGPQKFIHYWPPLSHQCRIHRCSPPQVLGRALRELPRSQVVLSTKVGRYGADPQDFDFSAERVTASVMESLERLQTSYIDIIQCHDIEFGDVDQVVAVVVEMWTRLRGVNKLQTHERQ